MLARVLKMPEHYSAKNAPSRQIDINCRARRVALSRNVFFAREPLCTAKDILAIIFAEPGGIGLFRTFP